jgi:hypothetical protein
MCWLTIGERKTAKSTKSPRVIAFATHTLILQLHNILCLFNIRLYYAYDALSNFGRRARWLLQVLRNGYSLTQYTRWRKTAVHG